MPRTSSRTPAQNDKKIPESTGATVAAKIATISATGNTEDKLSLNFSLSACNIRKASLRFGKPSEWNKGKDGADFFDMPFFCNICCGSCHMRQDLKDKSSSVCFADSFPPRGSRVSRLNQSAPSSFAASSLFSYASYSLQNSAKTSSISASSSSGCSSAFSSSPERR